MLTRLEELELSTLRGWVGYDGLSAEEALNRAIRCEQLDDLRSEQKFFRYAELVAKAAAKE